MDRSTALHITQAAQAVVLPRQTATPPAPDVLVVLHADGFVEVFGDTGLRVHVVNMLAVNQANEATAEEVLEAELPDRFRRVYWPAKRRAIGQVRTVTAAQKAATRLELDLLEESRAIMEDRR